MQNGRLDEAHAGIKMSGRNINNLRYAGDTTLVAEQAWAALIRQLICTSVWKGHHFLELACISDTLN